MKRAFFLRGLAAAPLATMTPKISPAQAFSARVLFTDAHPLRTISALNLYLNDRLVSRGVFNEQMQAWEFKYENMRTSDNIEIWAGEKP